MADTQKVPLQNTFFDLDSFQDVTVKKEFDYVPVGSVQEALGRLGNDQSRFLEIVNAGLVNEQRATERANPAGWQVIGEDGELGGEFKGTPADSKKVNQTVLNLAKSSVAPSMGLDWDSATKEQKADIRQKTIEFISSTPLIKNGLKTFAALKPGDVASTNGAE